MVAPSSTLSVIFWTFCVMAGTFETPL